jgi:hypothetical protein
MTSIVTKPVQPVLVPQNFDQLCRFAEMAATSDLMPRDYKGKPANIMLAVQMGSELGFAPMQSLQSIAVINGRPAVWGDGMIGLCRQSPLCEDIREYVEGEDDSETAVCVAKRKGASPVEGRFSVADAKKAGLWGKQGPWQQYPRRMLQNRARGFALRDAFPDLLRGLKMVEEIRDYDERQEPRDVSSTVVRSETTRAPAVITEPDPQLGTITCWRIYSRDGTAKELNGADAYLSEWRMRIAAVERATKLDDAGKAATLQRMAEANAGALIAIEAEGHSDVVEGVRQMLDLAVARHQPELEAAE